MKRVCNNSNGSNLLDLTFLKHPKNHPAPSVLIIQFIHTAKTKRARNDHLNEEEGEEKMSRDYVSSSN